LKISSVKVDRWSLWPALTFLAITGVLRLETQLPGSNSFFWVLGSALFCLLAAIAIVVLVVFNASRQRPRQAISLFCALIAPVLLGQPIDWVVNVVHLELVIKAGKLNIPGNGQNFTAFDWSNGLAGGPSTFLIRDETGEIALPPALHKHPLSDENGFADPCAGNVSHLLGPYYICNI